MKNIFIIASFCICNIVSEDKKKCLSYREFQNKEEFEDTQGVISNTYVKYNMSYLRYFCFVYVEWCPTLIVLCFCFVCLRLVYPMLLLTSKLLNQRFLLDKLKSSLRTFYGLHHDLVDRYGISVSQIITDMFHLS